MRAASMLVALMSLTAIPAWAQDPVLVDSAHYGLEFENDDVRVIRITYGPNESSVMHYHPAGVAVFLMDQSWQFTLPDGQTREVEAQAGEVLWFKTGSHLPQNLSDRPAELIFVEIKTQSSGS